MCRHWGPLVIRDRACSTASRHQFSIEFFSLRVSRHGLITPYPRFASSLVKQFVLRIFPRYYNFKLNGYILRWVITMRCKFFSNMKNEKDFILISIRIYLHIFLNILYLWILKCKKWGRIFQKFSRFRKVWNGIYEQSFHYPSVNKLQTAKIDANHALVTRSSNFT